MISSNRERGLLLPSESGVVAIVVTMIVLIVISITTLGFAQLARREQRQALDRQLSTEAFYAAEAGINDTVNATKKGGVTTAKNTCPVLSNQFQNLPTYKGIQNPSIPLNSTHPVSTILGGITAINVSYSCLLVDPTPATLEYPNIDPNNPDKSSQVMDINVLNGFTGLPANANTIRISWQLPDGTANFPVASINTFPSAAVWNKDSSGVNRSNTGVVQIDVTDVSGSLDRSTLNAKTMHAYLFPSSDGATGIAGSINFNSSIGYSSNSAMIIDGHCNPNNNSGTTPKYCNATISNLPAGNTHLYMRVKAIYNVSSVSVQAYDGPVTPNLMRISGSQILVDSTGKAGDIVRRVQSRLSISSSASPYYSVESVDSICKRLIVGSSAATTDMPGDAPCNP